MRRIAFLAMPVCCSMIATTAGNPVCSRPTDSVGDTVSRFCPALAECAVQFCSNGFDASRQTLAQTYSSQDYSGAECSAIFDQWSSYGVVQSYTAPFEWEVLFVNEFPQDTTTPNAYPHGIQCCGGGLSLGSQSSKANHHAACKQACADDERCEEIWAYDNGICHLKSISLDQDHPDWPGTRTCSACQGTYYRKKMIGVSGEIVHPLGQAAPLSSAAWKKDGGYARKWCNWCKPDMYIAISGQNYPDGRWDEHTPSISLPTNIDGLNDGKIIGTSEFTRPTHGTFGLSPGNCSIQFEVRVPHGKALSISGSEDIVTKSVLIVDTEWEEFRPDNGMPCSKDAFGCNYDTWTHDQIYNRFGCSNAGTSSDSDTFIDGKNVGVGSGWAPPTVLGCRWDVTRQQCFDDCEADANCDKIEAIYADGKERCCLKGEHSPPNKNPGFAICPASNGAHGSKRTYQRKRGHRLFRVEGSLTLTHITLSGGHVDDNICGISSAANCPAVCSSCHPGGNAGIALVNGRCTGWCSTANYCGLTSDYKTAGSTDCRLCSTDRIEKCRGGSIFVQGSSATLILTKVLLQGCPGHGEQCASLGGAVYVADGGDILLVESTITNSGGYHGGALVVSGAGAVATISDSTFLSNTASYPNTDGGCLIIEAAAVATIAGTIFENCKASNAGGGISLRGSGTSVTLAQSTFNGSSASQGSAIYNWDLSQLFMKNGPSEGFNTFGNSEGSSVIYTTSGATLKDDFYAPCAAGTGFSDDGILADFTGVGCPECAQGRHSATGSFVCTSCGQSTYATSSAASVCSPCPAGQYQDEIAASSYSCKKCGKGLYAASDSASACSSCPVGQFQDADHSAAWSCKTCPAGQIAASANVTCSACSIPKIQPRELAVAYDCASCPGGKMFRGIAQDCTTCKTGEFSTENASAAGHACQRCPIGRYLVADEFADASEHDGPSHCVACPSKTYNPFLGSSECFACPANINSTGAIICPGCDPGTFKDPNDAGQCLACGPGSYSESRDAIVCKFCPKGYFNTTLKYKCEGCPRGSFGDQLGQVDVTSGCKKCSSGRYSVRIGYDPTNDDATCLACPKGRWSNETGIDEKAKCQLCGTGLYNVLSGSNSSGSCAACPRGKFLGSVGGTHAGDCKSCLQGFSQNRTGQAFCLPCAPGRSQQAQSQALCAECDKGRFMPLSGSTAGQCEECLPGRVQERAAQTLCLPCGSGKKQPESGKAACLVCKTHTFSNKPEGSQCQKCSPGQYTMQPGAAECRKCVPGKYGDRVPETTFTVEEACKPCAAGAFAPNQGHNRSCEACPIGWDSTPGMSVCTKCVMGRYSPAPGVCRDCLKNAYAEERGAFNCTPCEMGEQFLSKTAACATCEVGKFASHPGNCTQCPHGWYTEDRGSRVCKVCEIGERYASPSSPCSSCERGMFGTKAKRACHACPSGWYQDTKKQDHCRICKNGNVKNNGGVCERCAAGMYGVSLQPCAACKPGLFASDRGQANCRACAKGLIPNNQSTDCKKPDWTIEADCEEGSDYLDDLSMQHVPDFECERDSECKASRVQHWACVACPHKAVQCANGVPRRSTMRTMDGWWPVPGEFLVNDAAAVPSPDGRLPTAEYHRCSYRDDCVNGSCVRNARGLLCSICSVGFVRQGGQCTSCIPGEVGMRAALVVAFVAFVVAIGFLIRMHFERLRQKYGRAWRDVIIAINILISFSQINTALPSMIPNFEWPYEYLTFLKEFSIFHIDVAEILGLNCMIQVDYRYSVMAAALLPVATVTTCWLAFQCAKRSIRASKLFRMPNNKKLQLVGSLFDLYDHDESDTIDLPEFICMLESTCKKGMRRELKNETVARNLMLEIGNGDVDFAAADDSSPSVSREAFLGSMTHLILDHQDDASEKEFMKTTSVAPAAKGGERERKLSLSGVVSISKLLRTSLLHKLSSMYIATGVQILLLFHAPISAKSFLYFDCHQVGAHEYLRRDYGTKCWSDRWFAFLPFALALMAGFALMVPLLLGCTIYRHRHDLYAPSTRQLIGWLYPRFQKGTEFWEVWELSRKLTLTGLIIYVPSAARTAVAILVCLGAVAMLNYFQPHMNRKIFWICQGSYVLTTCKYLVTTFSRIQSAGERLSENEMFALSMFLIGCDMIIFLGAILTVVVILCDLRKKLTKLGKQYPGRAKAAEKLLLQISLEDDKGRRGKRAVNGVHQLKTIDQQRQARKIVALLRQEMARKMLNLGGEGALELSFASLDKDANGKLSRSEFECILKTCDSSLKASAVILEAVREEVWNDMSHMDKKGQKNIECEDLRLWLMGAGGASSSASSASSTSSASLSDVAAESPSAAASKTKAIRKLSSAGIQRAVREERAHIIFEKASASANAYRANLKEAEKAADARVQRRLKKRETLKQQKETEKAKDRPAVGPAIGLPDDAESIREKRKRKRKL